MPQLRWTLLFLGVLFVVLLAWIEHRRQRRQGFSDSPPAADQETPAEPSPPALFREPALSLPEMRARDPGPPQELPVVEIEEDSLNPRRAETGASRVDPPTLSLPVLDSGPLAPRPRPAEPPVSSFEAVKPGRSDEGARVFPRLDIPAPLPDAMKPGKPLATSTATPDSEERAFNEAVFGEPREEPPGAPSGATVLTDFSAITAGGRTAGPNGPPDAADESTAEPEAPDEEYVEGVSKPRLVTEPTLDLEITPIKDPVVEWPPDDQRRVVALRLVAPPPERLAGRALRLALASEGFVLGKFQIFHKPDENGRAVLSAANLSKPGTFDLDNMDSQRYGGLSLFTVLPGPRPPLKAFEDLLATARNLNERLQGALQDERGGPLTPTRIASLRESLAAETTP
jgi:cell division protein ZipA